MNKAFMAVIKHERTLPVSLAVVTVALYVALAWVVSGGERWWVIDHIGSTGVFYGDDAYRFFLSRSAFTDHELYTYNFVLPVYLLLEGAVIALADYVVWISRAIHAVLAGIAVFFIYETARKLAINKFIACVAILVLVLMPRYALTSISFYGEFWLAFFLSAQAWLYVNKRYTLMAILSSLLPLIRPEGIYFLSFVAAFFLITRNWKGFFLLGLPGFMYFIYVTVTLDNFSDFQWWRAELREILNKIFIKELRWGILETCSLLLIMPTIFGFFFKPLRSAWLLWVPAVFWVILLQLQVLLGLASYEDRYLYIVIPTIILLWAGALQFFYEKIGDWFSVSVRRLGVGFIALAVIFSHLYQFNNIELSVKKEGWRLTISRVIGGEWEDIFPYYTKDNIASWSRMTDRIITMANSDAGIDKILMYEYVYYYFLDPEKLSNKVTIAYPTNGYAIFHLLLDGQIFAQHSHGKKYSYLEIGKPDFSKNERRLLYADLMPMVGYPYTWTEPGFELYLFSYIESSSPRVDVRNKPMVLPEEVDELYRRWGK